MLLVWVGFFVLILGLLFLDLRVVHRHTHAVKMREATMWTVVWIALGLGFSGVVYLAYEYHWGGAGLASGGAATRHGATAMWEYITGYLIEKSLSVDNIFVMAMLFRYFRVPAEYQHKVLFWGILGALVSRGVMIGIGTALIRQFDWIFYVFGAFLVFTAVRLMFDHDHDRDPGQGRIVRWAKRVIPLVERYEGDRFRVKVDGRNVFTLLFLAVVVIELTDIVFAVDSIPAVFGVTDDPFIVMTSNVFAILGLRALYFVVASAMRDFRYLNLAVSTILALVGLKMIAHDFVHIAPEWSLIGVVTLLTAGVVASIVANRLDARRARRMPDATEPPNA
jgi:tellurite resistance protein TerC